MKTVLIIKLKMSLSPPTVFHTQSPSSRQCVRIALSNAMQKTHTISCQSFQKEVKAIEEGAGSVIANFYNNLYDKKPESDNCPCWQENWSLTVALEYLKDHKMKGGTYVRMIASFVGERRYKGPRWWENKSNY